MADQNDQQSRSQSRILVRQVTSYQASWVEEARGQPSKFTIQLILDSGVEEYILDVASDDVGALLKLLGKSRHTTFDLERKVLMFANLEIG